MSLSQINTLQLVSANGLLIMVTIKPGVHLETLLSPRYVGTFSTTEKKNRCKSFLRLIMVTFSIVVAGDPQPERAIDEDRFGHLRFNSCWNEGVIIGST